MVNLTIDGKKLHANDGMTVLGAAKKADIDIPTLCWMKGLNDIASCRVCLVEADGELVASCNTAVREGMVVRTDTPRVAAARRANVEALMESHRYECGACVRQETCALRTLASEFNIADIDSCLPEKAAWDESFPLIRDASKCIKCMRCVAECSKVQYCNVWERSGSGPNMNVFVKGGLPISEAGCAACGQCITHCPTGALTARDDTGVVLEALLDPEIMTVVQVAPAVRSAWGEPLGLAHEDAAPSRMAAALRALGFDKVFDTDFAADLTIMEEGSEFVEFLSSDKPRPMFTSCCPGWVRFAKLHYPQFVAQLSSAKSPHQMEGAVVKNTLSAEADGRRIFVVSIMPCVAKKYECGVPQLSTEAGRDVDAVLTVREFDRMLKMFRIDCASLEETPWDNPLGLSTGAGTIFGRTGGVMEAALRSAVFLITGENPDFSACDTTDSTPEKPWVAKHLEVVGTSVDIAVASGLDNTAKLLDAIEAGEAKFDFVEIMACPGGCVGGGGQPIEFNRELAVERAANLNKLDAENTLRCSHENPDVQKLYADVLGKPLSRTSHEWLHTDQETWDI